MQKKCFFCDIQSGEHSLDRQSDSLEISGSAESLPNVIFHKMQVNQLKMLATISVTFCR